MPGPDCLAEECFTRRVLQVRAETKQAQLQEMLRVFNLTVDEDGLLSRYRPCRCY